MIDEILRNNLVIREWVNGALLPLNVSLVLVIGLFLWTAAMDARASRSTENGYLTWCDFGETWRAFKSTEGVNTACPLFWIFLADGIRAGSSWIVLNNAYAITKAVTPAAVGMPALLVIEVVNLSFVVAGLIAIIAGLRCVYVFTPPRWGHWYWIGTVAAIALFQTIF